MSSPTPESNPQPQQPPPPPPYEPDLSMITELERGLRPFDGETKRDG